MPFKDRRSLEATEVSQWYSWVVNTLWDILLLFWLAPLSLKLIFEWYPWPSPSVFFIGNSLFLAATRYLDCESYMSLKAILTLQVFWLKMYFFMRTSCRSLLFMELGLPYCLLLTLNLPLFCLRILVKWCNWWITICFFICRLIIISNFSASETSLDTIDILSYFISLKYSWISGFDLSAFLTLYPLTEARIMFLYLSVNPSSFCFFLAGVSNSSFSISFRLYIKLML